MNQLHHYTKIPAFKIPARMMKGATLLTCLLVIGTVGCKKAMVNADPGNPNEFRVALPSTTTNIIRGLENGDSLKAQIAIPDQPAGYDTAAYTYVWTSLRNRDTLGTRYFLTYKNFEQQEPTLISCLLTVTEKKSGIIKQATTSVFVTTATREGWVLLGDKSGTAKLSVLTYGEQGYKKFIDLDSELGINIPLAGKPISINTVSSDMPFGLSLLQWMGITTDQGTTLLNSMNFTGKQNITNYLNQVMPASPATPVRFNIAGASAFAGTRGSDVYQFSFFRMSSFGILSYTKLNNYAPATSFRASPHHTFTGRKTDLDHQRILYDIDSCEFVMNNKGLPLQLPFSKKGFQLKAIHSKIAEAENPDDVYAFLYNPVTEEGYFVEFLSNSILKKVTKILSPEATEIAASTFIEIDYNTGLLIYTKGNEVKAYDYKLGQTLSLLSFENETISLIKMERYIPGSTRAPGRLALYEQLYKRLVVCTYNPADPDKSGTFRLYQLLLGHQKPLMEVQETGFPKIVDVTFNPIP